MTVTVWNTPPPPQATVAETQAAVAALRQLGYHASLRLLPASTYYSYTNDSRNHAQVIDGGWSADYPSADAFISKLTCNYFDPGDGQTTTDASEFCDPALDRQTAHAAALQPTDPPAAAALWAQLDRQLTGLAIWLPTATPNETDLISRRTGNYQYNPVWGALIDQFWLRLSLGLALAGAVHMLGGWSSQYAAGGCRMQNSLPSGPARMCQRHPPSVTGVLVTVQVGLGAVAHRPILAAPSILTECDLWAAQTTLN
jgi:hypothetical protein